MSNSQLIWVVVFVAAIAALPVNAKEMKLRDFDRPATTLKDWLAQMQQQEVEAPVQVIGVKLNRTEPGLEIVLETQAGRSLQIDATKFKTEGNSLVATIANAVLALPDGQEFTNDNPTREIANVRIIQLDAATIRVSVTSKNALPVEEVTLRTGDLSYSLNPEGETPDEEIVVTGERSGSPYFAPSASSATRTDTPLRDIPASIQVVPQQVIQDQQVVRVEEALRNVSSVIFRGNNDGRGSNFSIRGFDNVPILKDGYRLYGTLQGFSEVANLERIEVLKGPASILYGEIQPGGVINLVSKQPLSEAFREVELQVGSRNFVRPRVDFSGPVTEDGRVLYRLNGLYQKGNTFRDYDEQFRRLSVAPALTWKISDRTDLTVSLESISDEGPADFGLFALGDRIVNVPRDRVPNDPDDTIENRYLSIGYNFEHRFSDNWKIRNSFRYLNYEYDYSVLALPFSVNERTGILNRVFADQDGQYYSYSLFTNLVGKFTTGAIKHTLLFGIDLNRSEQQIITVGDFLRPRPFNIFNPNYDQFPKPNRDVLPLFGDTTQDADRLGIYLQDQISLFNDALILVAGLRYDTVEQSVFNVQTAFTPGSDRSRQDDAVTPRIGIVYHPIPELSLYASYARSFNPSQSVSARGELLESEEGEGFEVGVKAELLNRKLFATLAYFDITKQNVAVADPVFLGFSVATGEQRSRGVELDINGEILPGWNVILTYAYTDAEVTKDSNPNLIGSRLVNVPEHSVGLWTTYEIQTGGLKGLGVGFGFNYVGERQGGLPNSFRVGSYFVPNAAIFYRRNQWRLAINFKNLSNADYIESVSTSRVRVNYPGEPFSVIGSVSYEF